MSELGAALKALLALCVWAAGIGLVLGVASAAFVAGFKAVSTALDILLGML